MPGTDRAPVAGIPDTAIADRRRFRVVSCRVDVARDVDRAQETVAVAAASGSLRSMTERHLVTIHVPGRPASFATAHEKPWKAAVRSAVAAAGIQPQDARFAVRMEFRVAVESARDSLVRQLVCEAPGELLLGALGLGHLEAVRRSAGAHLGSVLPWLVPSCPASGQSVREEPDVERGQREFLTAPGVGPAESLRDGSLSR